MAEKEDVNESQKARSEENVWKTNPVYHRYLLQHSAITSWMKEQYKQQDVIQWWRSMADYHRYMADYMLWLNHSTIAAATHFVHTYRPVLQKSRSKSSRRRSKLRRKKKRRQRSRGQNHDSVGSNSYSMEFHMANIDSSAADMDLDIDGPENVEFEFEMTKELQDFFAQSVKHRQERESLKAAQAEASTDDQHEHVDISSLSMNRARPTVLPPSERVGTRRQAEMKQLYGSGSPMVHGMETAMQLTFDRNLDKFKPQFWPAVPLNIQFD